MRSSEETCYVVRKNHMACKVNRKEHSQNLRLGTLVYVEYAIKDEIVAVRIDNSERLYGPFDEHLWECPMGNIVPFNNALKPFILAVSSPTERVALALDEDLCETLVAIEVGSLVYLLPKKSPTGASTNGMQHLKEAIVKYKGPVHQMGFGIYFGLELLDAEPGDSDACDGSYSGSSRYFSCPPGRGVFVAVNRLRPISDLVSSPLTPAHFNSNSTSTQNQFPFRSCVVQEVRAKFESMSHGTQVSPCVERTEKLIDLSPNRSPIQMDEQPLRVGERVVWFRDSGQEHGVVRWLGNLDPEKSDLHAGVEFDNPIGKTSGTYKGRRLFEAKKNHASFLPVLGLVRADDLYDNSSSIDLLKKKKKPSDIVSKGISSSNSISSGVLRPDQLYTPSKNGVPDTKWTSDQDSTDSTVNTNGVLLSPLSSEPSKSFFKNDTVHYKDKRESYYKDTDGNNHALSSLSSSLKSTEKLNVKINDSFGVLNDLVDTNGTKHRNTARPPKVNNGENESIRSDFEWVGGKSQAWASRTKQESSPSSNDRLGKVNACKDQSSQRTQHDTNDIDPDTLHRQSPDDPILGGAEGYYDTPEFHEFQELQDVPEPAIQSDLGVGSVVEVPVHGEPMYGVIRWIGTIPDDKKARKVAGIEMEEERAGFTDGTFRNHRYFTCNPQRALFVNINQCQKDSRFQEPAPSTCTDTKSKTFGQVDCPVIPGIVRPVAVSGDLQSKCGKFHGIQGHHNSCYLDATLFSMFTFTSVFDSLLYRPPTDKDCVQYEEVQRVLREEIVNPLRAKLFVRADRVMKLRTLLENHSSVTGLTSEEKDPEEFLNSLVAQILRAEPYLKLSSGQEAYHYQLFVEKDEQLKLPSVQKLFEQSFFASDIKLKEVPSCLIIQMPRFGKSFKMYPRILPSQVLDVTDVIEDSPRQCTVCGKLAEYECKECMDYFDVGLDNIAYCEVCLRRAHSHQRRSNHVWRRLSVPMDFKSLQEACSTIPRLYMELFAVVCIETSHYVAFVKCGSGLDAPWCFFDSMADRKGEQNGYNIPEMVPCPDLPYWLSDKGAQSLMDVRDNRQLPEHAKRLLCDAYMCMYQSSDVMMYR
ncbi:ubiquitin carboxyl-terminal hydrolase CYLD isoform X2 [Frankliniella occidentalis]|uniref:ubiquitinyl hydrolase 1 n=1 Tax=Frankliniella occidentalis TaxID=133901 RepID=A0A6J1SJN4_FRAOC|nr:ubiquitin carboxyl-terminal hydrolase CYLD isoform X2 [Frankliniella occidentalis]